MITDNLYRERPAAVRVEETVSGGTTTTYVANAKAGTLDAEAKWQLKKIVEVVAGAVTTTTITYPNGDNTYSYVWNDRAGYSYS